jgi:cytochrome o ubiquinol oxidase subunit 3
MSTNEETQQQETRVFGFWLYLMSDLVLFAALFATYAVLQAGTFGGPGGKAIFNIPFAFSETLILLTSSFCSGLALLFASRDKRRAALWLLGITGALGLLFVGMEISEFAHLVTIGDSPNRSAFLSSYFTLVGTHGLHVTIGILWLVALFISIAKKSPITQPSAITETKLRRLTLFTFFWHFLDLVWICIFTVVYLMGVI